MAPAAAPSGPTGLDLRIERWQLRLTQKAVAARLGIARQQVTKLEDSLRPTPRAVERYRAALHELSAHR